VTVLGRGTRTVLFTDMVGSTALRTALGDVAADTLRSEHEQVLRAAVEAHGGIVVKVMGDGLMAVFDGASDAVESAVALQQAVHRQALRAALPIEIRIGLAAGDVTWDSDDYHGTPVVEAARLEPKALPGTILASELVRMLAGSRTEIQFTPAGPFELKGLPGPVPAYEVAWSVPSDAGRPLPSALESKPQVPFVGRATERERLVDAWESAREGECGVVLITGEPGIGKTRLASEMALTAYGEGATVLFGRCDDELDVPYQPFVDALRHFVERCPPAYLRDELGSGAGELVRLAPELTQQFPELAPAPATDAETARYRLFQAVCSWFEAASSPEPILLVIDDLQWASKSTMLLVHHIVRSSGPMRLLLVATWRDTDAGPGDPLQAFVADTAKSGRVNRIRLDRLDRAEVDEYLVHAVREVADATDVATEASQKLGVALYRKSGGNPFFVQELTRDLVDVGGLDLASLDADEVARLGVPETIRDVVLRRVGRLNEQASRVLSAAAVSGREFEVSTLEDSLDLHGDEIIDALDVARAARLVQERADTVGCFEFEHGLVRDVLYRELGATRRARLHDRTARALERNHADDLDSWAADIASHLLAAGNRGDEVRATEYLVRAGGVALRGLSYEQAVAMFERALTAIEAAPPPHAPLRAEILLALGDARYRTLDFEGSRKAFLEAVDEARSQGDAGQLAQGARGLARAAQFGEADHPLAALLDEALAALSREDSYLRAQLLAIRAAQSLLNTNEGRRDDLVAQAVAMAERLGDPAELAFVLGVSVIGTFAPDMLSLRLQYLSKQFHTASRTGYTEVLCEAHGWRATAALERGVLDEVQEDVEAMARMADELGQPWYRAMAQQRRAMLAQLSGDYETAELLANASLSAAPQNQMSVLAGFAGLTWAIRRDQGRLAEVEPALVAFANSTPEVAAWQATIAVTALDLGRPHDALAALKTLVQGGLRAVPMDWLWTATMVLGAEVAAALDQRDAVVELMELLRPYERRGVPVAVGVAYLGTTSRALGLLANALGDYQMAIGDLEDAIEIETRLGAGAYEARARLDLARTYLARRGSGDAERAVTLLHDARRIAERLGLRTVASQIVLALDQRSASSQDQG
jgi:class 3 adenylate cyclase/tetratricopeptide (TPR) repeat protein